AVERPAIDPEHPGGLRLVATGRRQDLAHVATLELGQRDQLGGGVGAYDHARALVIADLFRQLVYGDLVVPGERYRALDAVLEFAHVPGPVIVDQLARRLGRYALDGSVQPRGDAGHEVLRQDQHVL